MPRHPSRNPFSEKKRADPPNDRTPLWNPLAGPSENGFPGPSYESIVNGTIGSPPCADEESLDSSDESSISTDSDSLNDAHATRVLSVLFLGVIISSLDATLVVATNAGIGSEFGRLQDSGWLANAYSLSMCAVQPIYGKMSDIYGRKACLLVAYAFFAIGCAISGVSPQFWQVIAGRAISGIGGAGMVSLVAVIITDVIPKREVAAWRGYINVCVTMGTSVGGPVGGFLQDTVGWRWMFFLQAPLTLFAAVLVSIELHLSEFKPEIDFDVYHGASLPASKFARIDFLGTITFATSIVSAMLIIDLGGTKFPYISWPIGILAACSVLCLVAFIAVETWVAKEPIFSLRILRKPNIVASYVILAAQNAAQSGMMFCVPLYFQVTKRTTATAAGAHLIPAIVGNATGSFLVGQYMRWTGRYKLGLVCAGLLASTTYVIQYLFWNGNTDFWESLYIFPSGFANGLVGVASFVAMTTNLEPQDVATATGGLFLMQYIGVVVGVASGTASLESELKKQLTRRIHGEGAADIIKRAMADVQYVGELGDQLRRIVVECYVGGLKHTYITSLACTLFGFVISHYIV